VLLTRPACPQPPLRIITAQLHHSIVLIIICLSQHLPTGIQTLITFSTSSSG
jgi:hypothetical protein